MSKPAMTDPSAPPLPTKPASPCIQVCTLDDDQVCIGCGRTVDDIIAWTRLTDTEKWTVLAQSAERRSARAQHTNLEQEVFRYGPKR
jgi:predicted Fe-S protein YdhL (DUF1289 family)